MSLEELKKLIPGLYQDKLSQEDEDRLFKLYSDKDFDECLTSMFYMNWQNSSEKSSGFSANETFDTIKNKLNIEITDKDRAYAKYRLEEKKNSRLWLNFVKYAAVFILAAVSSYLFFNLNDQDSMVESEALTEIKVKLGSKSTVLLPDSTSVFLNSGSVLRYPGNFTSDNRKVYLEGEAFFEVKPFHDKPFYVYTENNLSIRVLGTKFNVKAFKEEMNIETTLVSGKVEIEKRNKDNKVESRQLLLPDQIASFNKKSHELSVSNLRNETPSMISNPSSLEYAHDISPDLESIIAWKDNRLVFYNESLEDLKVKLERWFDVEIAIEDEEVNTYRFTGTFENETIEQVLFALDLAASFEYSINKNKIIIEK